MNNPISKFPSSFIQRTNSVFLAIAIILCWPCVALAVVWLLYWEPMEQKMSSEKEQLIASKRYPSVPFRFRENGNECDLRLQFHSDQFVPPFFTV